MMKIKKCDGAAYSAPECIVLEIFTEGALLSASNASIEGYDVDTEEFNW